MNYSYSIVTLVTFFIICTASCTTPPKTDPLKGYTTKYTRELWAMCHFAHRRANPTMNPNLFVPICDCVTDNTRNKYTRKEIESMEQTKLWEHLTNATSNCRKESSHMFKAPQMT